MKLNEKKSPLSKAIAKSRTDKLVRIIILDVPIEIGIRVGVVWSAPHIK